MWQVWTSSHLWGEEEGEKKGVECCGIVRGGHWESGYIITHGGSPKFRKRRGDKCESSGESIKGKETSVTSQESDG